MVMTTEVHKGDPKATTKDIYVAIARKTSLTTNQVKECFMAYKEILTCMAESPNRPLNYAVTLPHMGYFQFIRRHQDPNRKIGGQVRNVDMSKLVIKDEYDSLEFVPYRTLRQYVKESSYQRIKKTKEMAKKFGKEN